jgi:hypothetical protein
LRVLFAHLRKARTISDLFATMNKAGRMSHPKATLRFTVPEGDSRESVGSTLAGLHQSASDTVDRNILHRKTKRASIPAGPVVVILTDFLATTALSDYWVTWPFAIPCGIDAVRALQVATDKDVAHD